MAGLYVHIPFCASKCHYCDFYSLAGKSELLDRYINALLLESEKYGTMAFDTLYIGGGTPSMLGARRLEALLSGLSERLDLKHLKEANIEVNPESASHDFLRTAFSMGINRVSIGIQSLDDGELKKAGRIHDAHRALEAVNDAFQFGFDNVSADVIIGLPGQTLGTLSSTLDQLLMLKLSHISAYCLSVGDHTAFAVNPPADMVDDDCQAGFFETVVQLLKQSGFKHYEISNFSLPGKECLHNLNYWKGGEYIGLGPAAASHISGRRFNNPPCLEKYLDDPLAIVVEEESLDPEGKMAEEAMLRLRLLEEGLDVTNLEKRYAFVNAGGLKERLEGLLKGRMLVKCGGKYILPSDRVLISNQVFMNVLN